MHWIALQWQSEPDAALPPPEVLARRREGVERQGGGHLERRLPPAREQAQPRQRYETSSALRLQNGRCSRIRC